MGGVIKAIVTTLDNLPVLKEQVRILRDDPLVSEVWVVNNGSEDGTAEWLYSLGTFTCHFGTPGPSWEHEGEVVRSGNWKIRHINRENKGAGPGRNAGLDAAGACDYFLLLDGGIRPLVDGTARLLDYLERHPEADVIGVEIPHFETDYERAWRRWPEAIDDSSVYANRRLSHTAYCLARSRAFDGLRFCEEGPFGEPGWGADDDEMAYQWNEAGVVVHVVVGVHPYRRASGSFQRLFQETGVWPNQYGSVYEKRVVWLQQNWPQYQPGSQWGEPWLTVVVKAGAVEETAKLIKRAHDALRERRFGGQWSHLWNPYSVVAWNPNGHAAFDEWAEPRRLRQHHGAAILVDGTIVQRHRNNEATWAGDFRVWRGEDWRAAIRPGAFYHALVGDKDELEHVLAVFNEIHPAQPSALNVPAERSELK